MQDSHTSQEPPTPTPPLRTRVVPPSFSSPGGGRFQSGSLRDSLWEWERMEGWGCPGTFYVKDSGGCYRHRVGSLSLTAASALFFFIYLECSAGSWQAGEAMLMTPAPRGHHSGGKKKSCNVLSATLIRETHREPVAWRQLSSWYLPCMLITSPPGSESALSLGWWQ